MEPAAASDLTVAPFGAMSCEAIAAALDADALRRLLDATVPNPRLAARMQGSVAGREALADVLARRLDVDPGWSLPADPAARILVTSRPDSLRVLMLWSVALALAPALRRTLARADLEPAIVWLGEDRLRRALARGAAFPLRELPRRREDFENTGRSLLIGWAMEDPALHRLSLLLHPEVFAGASAAEQDADAQAIVRMAAEFCDDPG